MALLEFVEVFATIVTLLLLASGIPLCLSMLRTGRTNNVPYVYFLVSAINCVLALYYGMLVANSTFILINTVGFIFMAVYICVYIAMSTTKSTAVLQLLVSTVTVAAHGAYLKLMTPSPSALINTLGVFLFVWTVLLLLTPVLDIVDIVRQGTSAGTDMFLLTGATVCSATWLLYGYLLEDVFVYGPNVLGLAVNGVKIATIAAYSESAAKKAKRL